MMLLHTLPTGDPVHRYNKCLVVPFTGNRTILSTCPLNGGFREDLTAVINNDGNPGAGMACTGISVVVDDGGQILPIASV